jgi:hypothetical protein
MAPEFGKPIHQLPLIPANVLKKHHVHEPLDPRFRSLGSPLGIDAVKSSLAKPRRVPDGVARWFNGLDPDDLVTMGRR